jgi:selenide,water dikinase
MGFGLAVNGFIEPAKILGKNRALTGQKIILTKALGSGTLLAANMQHCAQGRWIDYAIGQMLIDNRKAAQVLTEYGATACTDITGFGLLGHLQEVMVASKVGAQLQLNTLPLLPGAKECLQKNILSTLHPQNVAASSALLNASEYKSQPIFNILFDPQTAGGLLATINADNADACLQTLHDNGLSEACIIGTVEDSIAEGTILLI